MCGIVAIAGKAVRSKDLEVMTKSLTHRGPDGYDYKLLNNCGLGHTRLAIIDPVARSNQPMACNNQLNYLTFNGEIYNFKELKQEIGDRYPFQTSSDTEVVLAGLILFGPSFIERLNGIFAFAWWNQTRQELLIARDDMGVKPLYYSVLENEFVIASELSTMLQHSQIKLSLATNSIAEYSSFLWVSGTNTLISSIKDFKAGHYAIYKDKQLTLHCYRSLIQDYATATKLPTQTKPLLKQLDQTLSDTVKKQLIADVPVGCFLSGGVDSSLIAYYAKQHHNQMQAFCVDTGDSNDSSFQTKDVDYAKYAAKQLGLQLDVLRVNSEDFIDIITTMATEFDTPVTDPAVVNTYLISKQARAKGMKVMLAGSGADDIFSGYRRHAVLPLLPILKFIPNVLIQPFAKLTQNSEKYRRVNKLLQLSKIDFKQYLLQSFQWEHTKILQQLLNFDVSDAINQSQFADNLQQIAKQKQLSKLLQILLLEQLHFLGDHNLKYTDAAAMRAGVEIRVPYLDRELRRLVSAIPDNQLLHNLTPKWLLKKLAEQKFGRQFAFRPKVGFGLPLNTLLRGQLKDFIGDILHGQLFANRSFINTPAVIDYWQQFQQGNIRNGYTLFALANLELWLQKHQ